MLATQQLCPIPGSFMVSNGCGKRHVELDCNKARYSRVDLRVDARRTATDLRERSIKAECNQQPEDQESLITVSKKWHQVAPLEVAEEQPPRKQEEAEEEEEEEAKETNIESELRQPEVVENEPGEKRNEYKMELVWTNIIALSILHLSLPVGVYLLCTQRPWKTFAFMVMSIYMSALGITGGAHRLWSHRSYKARWPVQVLFIVLQTLAGQNSTYTWCRDHRVHHKYSETNADPHNIERGLFFAHMGWLCCKKHPEVREKGKQIDMSDLESNPYVMFQHRHFWWMSIVFTVLVPTMIPVLCWGEQFWTSFVFCFMIRYVASLHATWLVNSVAHHHGTRPYDTSIRSCEANALLYTGIGESSHNYHHTFPYDYAASELGRYFNLTTIFIDFCADLGFVSGRRRVSAETLMKRRQRTGDLANHKEHQETPAIETAEDEHHQDF